MFLTQALAGPTYTLADTECDLAKHVASLVCTKGLCVLDEELTYYKPDCRGAVTFDGGEAVDPLVLFGETWHVAAPCPAGVCVSEVPNHTRTRRVLPLGRDGQLRLVGEAELSLGRGLRSTGSSPQQEIYGKPSARGPRLAALPEAAEAVASTATFGGPLSAGLRDGTWLAAHPDGRPLVREVTYDRGVRVQASDWLARTATDASGRMMPVPELDACPRSATFDTVLATQLTQRCDWTDEGGQHAIVATFDVTPWQLRGLEQRLNDRRSGPTLAYNESGQLTRRERYSGGTLVGTAEVFHPSGALAERTERRSDGSIRSHEQYSPRGILLERREEDIPGMGDQIWTEQYDSSGRLLAARIPESAAVAIIRTWTDDGYSSHSETTAWQAPNSGCGADIDCPGGKPGDYAERHLVGMCDQGTCTKVLAPKQRDKDLGVHPLREGFALEQALDEAIGEGRSAWISPNLIRSEQRTCVEVTVSREKLLEDDAPLAARTPTLRRVERDVEVLRWLELDLTRGLLSVRARAGVESDAGLEPWVPSRVPSPTLALSKVDERGAHYHLDVFDLQAVCVSTQTYVACPESAGAGWQPCETERLLLREYSDEPVPDARERPAGSEVACNATCPTSHCAAEAARLDWRFRLRPFQRPHDERYTLWWRPEDCARDIGL